MRLGRTAPPFLLGLIASTTTAQPPIALPDPSPDPAAAIGSAALLTPSYVVVGAAEKRSLDATRLPTALGAVLVWPRDLSGDPQSTPIVLLPTDGKRSERFGAALAWRPGLLAVGSPGYDTTSSVLAVGRVRLLDDSFATVDTLAPPTPLAAIEFGASLALDGSMLVVGGPGWRAAAPGPTVGAAFVFVARRGSWTFDRQVSPPDAGSRFGNAVTLTSGKFAVGAPGGAASPPWRGPVSEGHVWLYDRGDAAIPPTVFASPQAQLGDRFGLALASVGDILAIGAPGSVCEEGRVYVGRVSDAGWTHLATLAPPDESGWIGFGNSVAAFAGRIVVGTGGIADNDSYGHRSAVYERHGDAWDVIAIIDAPPDAPACGMATLDAAGVLSSEPLGGDFSGGAMRYDALGRSPDLDGDGHVGAADLAILLGAWGTTAGVNPADLDGDGSVGPADLATLLGGWTR